MPNPQVIWTDTLENLVIELQRGSDRDIEDLLSRTVWGNRDLRYIIKNVGSKLARLREPYFFSLRQDGTLVAVCVLNRRITQVLGRPYDSCHFVMLATDERAKGRGFAGLLTEQIRRYCERELRSPAVAYAYIESGTDYSLRISNKVGYRFRSRLFSALFSRFWPRDHRNIQLLNKSQAGDVIGSLYDLYKDHMFLDFDQSLVAIEYYVLIRNGKIVAGAQAEVLSWSITRMSGVVGWLVLKVLPHIPWLRDLLPLHNFRFLRFGNILVRTGHEGELPRLLEGVLARNNARVGLILMDERSPVLQAIRRAGKLGVLNALFGRRVKMVADFKGTTDEDIQTICRGPIVVSPLDVI